MNDIGNNIYNNFTPMPADTQGWNSDSGIFKNLINEIKPKVIVEVGTWKGRSAINMASTVKAAGLKTKIYCVDTWLGAVEFWTSHKDTTERNLLLKNGYPQIYYQFLSNVIHADHQDCIIPIPLPSTTAWQVLEHYNVKADLIYIDASHVYEDVLADIKNYSKVLNTPGIMFGDDIGISGQYFGVRKAVEESFAKNFEVIENNFWVYRKS